MKPKRIFLKDYTKPDFSIVQTDMLVQIFDSCTLVRSTTIFKKEEASVNKLVLNGVKLKLKSVSIDGTLLKKSEYTVTDTELILPVTKKQFTVETVVEINPKKNDSGEGFYHSGSIFCTQCEPQGFRKITYFLDRPDVMTMFTVRMEAEKKKYPYLLSNGNQIGKGSLAKGRHYSIWEDPFKKPSYLFAMVAGDFGVLKGTFITKSKRRIKLELFVDHGYEKEAAYAFQSLKDAMKWDEERFGRECDLDQYMIVAASSFNSGAMENKGLNIFNTACMLGTPETTADMNLLYIQKVIGHEYFHNWTGNRITCRDWFQLTLKEGLTVFRDQEFSSDLNSRPVHRIQEVSQLKEGQFVEDAGATAHPIQPQSYIAMNNFYTRTVYDKGAEVIRMLFTILGKQGFRKGMDTYFKRYDGQAVTVHEFVKAMEIANKKDFTQFKRWYVQAGTPRLKVTTIYDAKKKTYALTIEQSFAPNVQSKGYKEYYLPFEVGLLNSKGKEIAAKQLIIKKNKETFVFTGIKEQPIPSLLRNFSAPVMVDYKQAEAEKIFLAKYDTDEFNRYNAVQEVFLNEAVHLVRFPKSNVSTSVLGLCEYLLNDKKLNITLKAEMFSLPSITTIASQLKELDYQSAQKAKEKLMKTIAQEFEQEFAAIYMHLFNPKKAYSLSPKAVAQRAMQNKCLSYLSLLGNTHLKKVLAQYEKANNMTEKQNALACLINMECKEKEKVLASFAKKWAHHDLVMNKWFTLQAMSKLPGTLQVVKQLRKHKLYDERNPNKMRSLIAAFIMNSAQFHNPNGSGYKFIANEILKIDKYNSQMSGRMMPLAFQSYARLPKKNKALIKKELSRMKQVKNLSGNVYEFIEKIL